MGEFRAVSKRIVTLPGDGIGPEIMRAAELVLRELGDFELDEQLVGGISIDAHGTALTDEVLDACRGSDAVLLAAVGGPKWDTTDPGKPRPEQGLLGLRKGLALFANLRPVRPSPALLDASPLKRELIEDVDLLVVRELTGGIYFGDRGRRDDVAYDTCTYSVEEVRRIASLAFEIAASPSRRGRLVSIDKANILETSRLWRATVDRVAADHPGVRLEHMLVDNAAMQLVSRPADFDVVLTENMFGDILSDEAAMVAGSIGLLASASLGAGHAKPGRAGAPGLFEPVHGSAPDIAGRGIANPLAMFGSVALMLRHSLGMEELAAAVESAVDRVLERGFRTPDLASGFAEETLVGTAAMTQAVIDELGAPTGGA
jgi:3-isopropylmalate dehydrogenase